MTEPWEINREGFPQDPAGYAMLGWTKWAMLQENHGLPIDPEKLPSSKDLKSPMLWLSHSVALTEAALVLLRVEPGFENMPSDLRGIADTQYCAVALMLVGYSLEVCLKAMLILQKGTETYIESEKVYQHHQLTRLADFIFDLTTKDKAILALLTHFTSWAGRYPDPGTKRHQWHEEVFRIADKNRVAAKDLFKLAAKVQGHIRKLID